ncbi:MAG TPA: SRPBCC family protein [Polyangia bacterium]|nr:SRPBCC family protein [Polyangia bacterium]
MDSQSSDRIEKRVTLRAPLSRVWRAIADAHEFGSWFGFQLDGPFVAGKTVTGTFQGTLDEAAIMEQQKRLGLRPSRLKLPEKNFVFCTVERIEPERYFSFRWIPYGIDAEIDPQNEPTTLVEFRLEPVPEGTLVTIVESGFDRVPAHRRERAFRMNEGGWEAQAQNLARYVDGK